MAHAGQILREARCKAKLSQRQSASMLGISWQAWGNYEQGYCYIPEKAWQICGVRPPWEDRERWGHVDYSIKAKVPHGGARRDFGAVRRPPPPGTVRDARWRAVHRAIARIVTQNPGMSTGAISRALDVPHMTVLRHRRVLEAQIQSGLDPTGKL